MALQIEEIDDTQTALTRTSAVARLFGGELATFTLLLAAAVFVMAFAFATVHARAAKELEANPGARRAQSTIQYWTDHGYFASGGLMSFDISAANPTGPPRAFYRSSSGFYMLSGYAVERIAMAITGKYQWRAIAIHNEILMLFTAALGALLMFRLVLATDVSPADSLVFAFAVEGVFLTFPEVLNQYWELAPQPLALTFAFLFLLIETAPSRTRATALLQNVAAFFLVYTETIFGCFFLLTYCLYRLLRRDERPIGTLLLETLLPIVAALLLFKLQIAWVRSHYPGVPMQGSEFLFRTGLDGSAQYYRGHLDIIFGRNVARSNFPANRDQLFNWMYLFLSGTAAAIFVIAAAARRPRFDRILLTMLVLLGGYVVYGAVFSQAVVIHPYLYDLLIATPLIFALFGFAPAILDLWARSRSAIAIVTLLAAIWCAMVQMRHYALWYPTTPVTTSSLRILHASRSVA